MERKRTTGVLFLLLTFIMVIFSGCKAQTEIDDYATNHVTGADRSKSTQDSTADQGIAKQDIKVGVLHLSDPAEGGGYSYTHDLGIQGMQENLGLSDDQIVRKLNVDDTDSEAVKKALQECVDEGCNIIFATSWGYMEPVAEMAEEYPDVYFSSGTGYLNNGKNYNNYFGRIYQARYLSGIVGRNEDADK